MRHGRQRAALGRGATAAPAPAAARDRRPAGGGGSDSTGSSSTGSGGSGGSGDGGIGDSGSGAIGIGGSTSGGDRGSGIDGGSGSIDRGGPNGDGGGSATTGISSDGGVGVGSGDSKDGDGAGDGDSAPGAGPRAWCAVAALLGAGAALGVGPPAAALDWQPALAWQQPWRAWSAAFVHLSALHLAANAAGLILVAALGAAARLPRRTALAWFAAWPLAHLGLLAEPALAHYGGLSGVLHAGVAAAALHLAWRGAGTARGVGFALLGGLALKVLAEAPWAHVLRHPAGWDIAVAPAAHACGAIAGVLCAAAGEALAQRGERHGRS